jgi:hypothetical protein
MGREVSHLRRMARSVRWRARSLVDAARVAGHTKYFCVGRNKTGTTSLAMEFEALGFVVAPQAPAERLADAHYFAGRFRPIVRFCRIAEVFQDVPFSWPGTFRHLDAAWPGSKFILTVRDDEDQWYRSVARFHSKLFGRDGRLPTAEDLRAAPYVRPGFMTSMMRVHGTSEDAPYDEGRMKASYQRHNAEVVEHFRDRSDDLLVLNLGRSGDYRRFLDFVGATSDRDAFPWVNKT